MLAWFLAQLRAILIPAPALRPIPVILRRPLRRRTFEQ